MGITPASAMPWPMSKRTLSSLTSAGALPHSRPGPVATETHSSSAVPETSIRFSMRWRAIRAVLASADAAERRDGRVARDGVDLVRDAREVDLAHERHPLPERREEVVVVRRDQQPRVELREDA